MRFLSIGILNSQTVTPHLKSIYGGLIVRLVMPLLDEGVYHYKFGLYHKGHESESEHQ